MHGKFNDDAVTIPFDTWERRGIFELFGTFSEPYHGVCLRVDCTETFLFAKQHHLSVFLSLLHRALHAAQQVENFRTRIVDGSVLLYQTIHGGSAVGLPNGTIGFGHYPYHPSLADFVREGSIELDRVRNTTVLDRPTFLNLIRFSVLPWFDFASISHATDTARRDSAPKITFGKITEANGRHTMPVSIHVHHALADGLHVAQFVERFQQSLSNPEAI